MEKLIPNREESRPLRVVAFWPSSPSAIEEDEWNFLEKHFPFLKVEAEERVFDSSSNLPYLAMDDRKQARRFLHYFEHNGPEILWAVRGGYGVLRWAGLVAEEMITKIHDQYPIVIGFSDVSLLHLLLFNAGIPSIHGPMINTLKNTSKESIEALAGVFKGEGFPPLEGMALNGGRAQGRLLPVNLSCLVSSIGTRIQPKLQGQDVILAIEDHKEPLYRIDRMLTQLLESGFLHEVKGICIGDITLPEVREQNLLTKLLADRLSRLNCPVIYDLPFGHTTSNMPLLQGATYEVDGASGLLTML